jgi:hypothetical protein
VAKVDGFNIQFSHRGSWTADILAPGKPMETIPVCWRDDYDFNNRTIFVWLKKQEEVDRYMAQTNGFRIAIGSKNKDGSTSADNIGGIFHVKPLERSDEERIGLTCQVEGRVKASDK